MQDSSGAAGPSGENDPHAAVAELSVKVLRRLAALEERVAELEQGQAA